MNVSEGLTFFVNTGGIALFTLIILYHWITVSNGYWLNVDENAYDARPRRGIRSQGRRLVFSWTSKSKWISPDIE